MKNIATIILFSFAILANSQEIKPLSSEKTFFYGSLSLVPGGGVSYRERNSFKGTAFDTKIGFFPFVFDTVSWFPVVALDYNYVHYVRENEATPYFSLGVGAGNLIPYIPLRAGMEFKNGFVDLGAKMIFGIYPSPEVRGGFHITF